MATGNHVNNIHPGDGVSSSRPGLVFAALFLIAALLTAGLLAQQYTALSAFARSVTITTTSVLGNLLGLSVTSNADILTVNGFAMRIIDQCTASTYIVILACAILLYTRHTIRYRLIGVIMATVMVIIANSVRLLVTGMTGTVSREAFDFVHEYLWVGLFALLVFGIWKVWADKSLNLTRRTAQYTGIVTVSCTVTYLFLIVFKDAHFRMQATLAAPLFKILIGDPQAILNWNGSLLQFTQGLVTVEMATFFEMANIAVYVGLMLPYLWRNRKAILPAVVGLVLLEVMYAEFIAFMGMKAFKAGIEAAQLYQFIGSGLFLAFPLALYWIITSFETK